MNTQKIKKVFVNKQIVVVFVVLSVLIISGYFAYNKDFTKKLLNNLGYYRLLRQIGLSGRDIPEFFLAMNTQNLAYDYNNDGVVSGEDYSGLLKKVGDLILEDDQAQLEDEPIETTLDADDYTESSDLGEDNNFSAPSVRGMYTNEFTGSANVNYPISLPAGIAGLTPSLGLHYSSDTVDEIQVGTRPRWRDNDDDYPQALYQNQAGVVGLGWSLSGFGAISRDMGKDLEEINDDTFVLSYSGGAANLTLESSDGLYTVWRTTPNLKVKIERYGLCTAGANCRYHWIVTEGDGTKYYFGSLPTNDWRTSHDPDASATVNTFYALYDSETEYGTRAWVVRRYENDYTGAVNTDALTYKWLLYRVESPYHQEGTMDISINYYTKFEFGDAGSYNYNKDYVRASYPARISYSTNEVIFTPEDRLDKEIIGGYDDDHQGQKMKSNNRISKITVNSLGSVRSVYTLDYKYGWRPADHGGSGVPDNENEVEAGKAIHSLLVGITQWSGDPSDPNSKRLPSSSYWYGDDCLPFVGGCPLTAWDGNGTGQVKTPNDFFLLRADNGYGGRVEFEYDINNEDIGNAFNVKTCLDDNTCETNHNQNTQRHRVAAMIVNDGMGNSIKTEYNYFGDPLAFIKSRASASCSCGGGTSGIECHCRSWCENPNAIEGTCNCYPGGSATICGCRCDFDHDSFSGYEFLGYPEVETIVYQENSSTEVAARTRNWYYQSLESVGFLFTEGCFKRNPLAGTAYKTRVYDVDAPDLNYSETLNKYTIRIGDMFSTESEVDIDDLTCSNYDPKETVVTILPEKQINKVYIAGNATLCTKTESVYDSNDPYALPVSQINWGEVDCSNTDVDIDSEGSPKYSFVNYTQGDQLLWRLPLVKESWISDTLTGEKYNHTKTYYDNQPFGQRGNLGQVTKTQVMIDGSVYSEATNEYSPFYPWQLTRVVDPLGRVTTTQFDNIFHTFPVRMVNSLGHEARMEYDFNTTDTSHPNYGGNKGLVIKSIDANDQVSTSVYDVFGRVVASYLPGRTPGMKPNTYRKYFYFNQGDMQPGQVCNDANNCIADLGRQISGSLGPKMVVYSGSLLGDTGSVGVLSEKHVFYNGLGQRIQTRNLFYDGEYSNAGVEIEGEGKKDIISSTDYNSLGNVLYQSQSYTSSPYIANNTTSSYDTRNFVTDPQIKKSRSYYDGLGRAYRTDLPDGSYSLVDYDYNGDPLVSSSLGFNCTDNNPQTICTRSVNYANAFGQNVKNESVTYAADAQPGDPRSTVYSTFMDYHPILGTITSTYDNRGNEISRINYDKLGRKISMWDIDMSPALLSQGGGLWEYEYDLIGNLTRQTNPKGDYTTLVYDQLGRLSQKRVNGKLLLSNYYDNCQYGLGKLCRVISYDLDLEDPVKEKEIAYNPRGLIIQVTTTLKNMPDDLINNLDFVTEYTYDEAGRMLSEAIPQISQLGMIGEEVVNIMDGPHQVGLNSFTSSSPRDGDRYVYDAKYNKDGQILAFTSGNSLVNSFTYNLLNMRMETLSVTNPSDDTNYIGLSYSYDPSGNILDIVDSVNSGDFNSTQHFVYDALNRLSSVSGAYQASYRYDDIGNILRKTEGEEIVSLNYGDYNSGFYHRPQSFSLDINPALSVSYDQVGNMITEGEKEYVYDESNRLKRAVVPPETTPIPTVVDLTSFTAQRYSDHVLVEWETASEIDSLGFNLYRSSTDVRPDTPINVTLIASQFSGLGASYDYQDSGGQAGDYYWLEAVNSSGGSQFHGPIQAEGVLTGDADGDGVIDRTDYTVWINNYLSSNPSGSESGDFNGDGSVDGVDYVIWRNAYNQQNQAGWCSDCMADCYENGNIPSCYDYCFPGCESTATPTPTTTQAVTSTPTSTSTPTPTGFSQTACNSMGGVCRSTQTGCYAFEYIGLASCGSGYICCVAMAD